jgi:UDP-2,3-diacylglucosamine pyrophosphatase LpxH
VEARRRTEHLLQMTLASIGEAVIATDDRGAVTILNRAAKDLGSWPPFRRPAPDSNSRKPNSPPLYFVHAAEWMAPSVMIGAGLSGRLYGGLIRENLRGLFERAPRVRLSSRDRLVIFSDLHLGDGGHRDDFRPNGGLLSTVLREHYLARGFSLVLNGDIEELQRFSFDSIHAHWRGLLSLFGEFGRKTALYKIAGNHDERLFLTEDGRSGRLLEAVRFDYHGDTIFVFHGHQATVFFESFNRVSEFFLRHVANTLRIPNFPVAYRSGKRYWTEHRVYAFSSERRIVSVIGHTHRPLFESLSKIDTLKFRIERLCRDYPLSPPSRRVEIERAIESDGRELRRLWDKDRRNALRESLYDSGISVPCLFNSGCGIGKRGVTAVEIAISPTGPWQRPEGSRPRIFSGRSSRKTISPIFSPGSGSWGEKRAPGKRGRRAMEIGKAVPAIPEKTSDPPDFLRAAVIVEEKLRPLSPYPEADCALAVKSAEVPLFFTLS